jgi:hypothetical protein
LFVESESAVLRRLAESGHTVTPSSLLFQGGNLLTVQHPATNQRALLIGEAEIARNTALGLTADQTREAFRVEFDVDTVTVLPASSFHLDFELTIRAVDDKLVAFVNDEVAAARLIIQSAADPLQSAGLLTAQERAKINTLLDQASDHSAMDILEAAMAQRYPAHPKLPNALAEAFATSPVDSGVGNLQAFLVALDVLRAADLTSDPPDADRFQNAYFRSMRRLNADRETFRNRLKSIGFEVVAVPSLSQGNRGLNYLNGLHAPGAFLMPAWGGLYDTLDDAARHAFESAMGPSVTVEPVLSAESQRRGGGVHCSVAAYRRFESRQGERNPKSRNVEKSDNSLTRTVEVRRSSNLIQE